MVHADYLRMGQGGAGRAVRFDVLWATKENRDRRFSVAWWRRGPVWAVVTRGGPPGESEGGGHL